MARSPQKITIASLLCSDLIFLLCSLLSQSSTLTCLSKQIHTAADKLPVIFLADSFTTFLSHSHGAEDTQQGNQIGRAAKRRRNQNVAQRVTAEGFKDEEETSVAAGEKRKKV